MPLPWPSLGRLAGLVLLCLSLAQPAAAQSPYDLVPGGTEPLPPALAKSLRDKNPVVARVNGREIRWNDVILSALNLPPVYQAQVQLFFPALLARLIDLQLLADAGRSAGLLSDREVQARLRLYEDQVLREAFVKRLVDTAVDPKEVQKRVDVLTFGGGFEEVRLRIIITGDIASAREVLRLLNKGLDFAQLAASFSTGATAAEGGDLGWRSKAEIEPAAVAEQAFSLAPGRHSERPLETPGGWMLVKVEERRSAENVPKDKLAIRIHRELGRLALDGALWELRRTGKIQLFPEK